MTLGLMMRTKKQKKQKNKKQKQKKIPGGLSWHGRRVLKCVVVSFLFFIVQQQSCKYKNCTVLPRDLIV
jgi:hypothetical protein